MQLSFDPRDRNAATSALAVILALHPDLDDNVPEMPGFPIQTQDSRLLEPDAPDAAEAFGGGNGPVAAPTAPAVPAAPNTGTPAAHSSPNPGGVEVDANGLPWDGRIHSGPADSKPKNADGTWRKKRGVSDDEVASVTAALRAALAAPAVATPAPPPVAEVPAAPVPPAPPPVAPAPPVPVPAAPVPTAAPIAPVPTPPAADTALGQAAAIPAGDAPATTFAELMKKVTARQAAGVLTVTGTTEISQALGITGVRDLLTRPDLVPSFDALLPAMPV